MITRVSIVLVCIVSLAISFILLAGCSSKGTPVTASNGQNEIPSIGSLPVGVTDYSPDGSPSAGMGTLGLYDLRIDPTKVTAEITPLRKNESTDVLEVVDLTNFLRMSPCTNCVKIKSVALDSDEHIVVSIGIKHPFPAGDPGKPITGRNRADLHVFNVEGIVISNAAGISFPGMGETIANFKLLSADGYTKYLDNSIDDIYPTDATIHPYVLHFDDYSSGNFDPSSPTGFTSVTTPPPSGNLVMAMGSDYNVQDYVFDVSSAPIDFIYAAGCTYALSASSKAKRFQPEYRVPQHNKKAASEVHFEIVLNDLKAGDTASTAQFELKVVDINNKVLVGTALNELLSDSSVDDIFIDVPGVMTSMLVLDGNNPVSGTGHSPADPLVYQGAITNTAAAPEGSYAGLIKVTDTYAPGQNGAPTLHGKDGIKLVDPMVPPTTGLFDITEFATYATFTIDVAHVATNLPPVAVLKPNPASCDLGDNVDFDGTSSYDTDGIIVKYEFDFDWDGVEANFSSDATNATGLASSPPYMTEGSFTAGLRVTDNNGAIDYDSVPVTVVPANVIYVDDSYVGPPYDGTMQHPFNTIQEGLAVATAGYQVWVDDSGNNYIGPLSINSKNDIKLRSVNWDASDGGNTAAIYVDTSATVVSMSNSTNFTLDGFKIWGSSYGGLSINGCPQSTVKNCDIAEIGVSYYISIVTAVWVSGSPGLVFENNSIRDCELNESAGGILNCMYISDAPITIRNCDFHDNDKPNIAGIINVIYCSECVPNSGYHLEIYNNKIHDIHFSSAGFINAIYFSASNDVEIHNNLIYNLFAEGSGGGIFGVYLGGWYDGQNEHWATDINITNNVFYNFQYQEQFGMPAAVYANPESNYVSNINATNNIIGYFHDASGGLMGQPVYYSSPNVAWNYNDTFDVQSNAPPAGTGNLSLDAEFVDPSNGNFHLGTGSPCIDAGDPAILDTDNSRSDMGAYGGPDGDW